MRTTLVVAMVLVVVAGAGLCFWNQFDQSREPLRVAAEIDGDVPTPEVFWPYGTPYGKLQDNAWARAYIEYTTRYAAAFNARDFSDSRLKRLAGDGLGEFPDGVEATQEYALGPRPLRILSVDEAPDGNSAEVKVCEVTNWALSRPLYTSDSQRRIAAKVRVYTESLDGKNIRLEKGADSSLDGVGGCFLDATQVGYFVPTPAFS